MAKHQHKCGEARFTGVDSSEKLQQAIMLESQCVNCVKQSVSDDAPAKLLPEFEHFLTGLRLPSVRPLTELGTSDAVDADQLETERADFQDVVPRFQQNIAWPSQSNTQSSSAAFDVKSHCRNQSARNSCSNSSEEHKTAVLTSVHLNKKQDHVVDSNSDVPISQAASSAVLTTDGLSLSRVLQQLNSLSQQLAAQVTVTHKML